jgi:hypothetical protein
LNHVLDDGWLDLRQDMADWHGIVRIYDVPCGLDLGRSTFQALAFGRWYITRAIREPLIESVNSVREIPPLVRHLLETVDMKYARKRWKYIKTHFTEEALHERWLTALREAIGK